MTNRLSKFKTWKIYFVLLPLPPYAPTFPPHATHKASQDLNKEFLNNALYRQLIYTLRDDLKYLLQIYANFILYRFIWKFYNKIGEYIYIKSSELHNFLILILKKINLINVLNSRSILYNSKFNEICVLGRR
jgi:hypothetical protein